MPWYLFFFFLRKESGGGHKASWGSQVVLTVSRVGAEGRLPPGSLEDRGAGNWRAAWVGGSPHLGEKLMCSRRDSKWRGKTMLSTEIVYNL